MNYRVTLKVERAASDAQIRKQMKIPDDVPITKRDVQQFARIWQEQVSNSSDVALLVSAAETEVGIIWQ